LSLHDPHEQDFDRYVARKRVDGVFGNNLEMQAMAELYNRPIEVCAVFSSNPGPRCS
jgi:OTU domain-containing protein 5